MRALLDTNILIHREARTAIRNDIGTLFKWLDLLKYSKCVHPDSLEEIKRHADPEVVWSFQVKLGSYDSLKTLAPDTEAISAMRSTDATDNDTVDTSLLAEIAAQRVDVLISEDRGVHRKASSLSLSHSVFTIDGFLEKVTAEYPELSDYKVLAVKKARFGEIEVADPFFDSFRDDYEDFDLWFNRKADEEAYVVRHDDGSMVAFLYLKREGRDENYSDISPRFIPMTRLKIGTFKVIANGYKLGERLLKIVFDNALANRVGAVYVTLYRKTADHDRLARLLLDWGFVEHGEKDSTGGPELVMVRGFAPQVDLDDPRRTFPYVSAGSRKFIVPIYPRYHTDLLPDSVLNTENPEDVADSKSHRNALSKVYISRSLERNLQPGDIIVFYRTKDGGPAHYTSVVTTIGVVQSSEINIPDQDAFIAACRKRSVFSDAELLKHWNYKPGNRPFVVNFLFVCSFPRRPNLEKLRELGILTDAPRGFERLTDEAFDRILGAANVDRHLVVD